MFKHGAPILSSTEYLSYAEQSRAKHLFLYHLRIKNQFTCAICLWTGPNWVRSSEDNDGIANMISIAIEFHWSDHLNTLHPIHILVDVFHIHIIIMFSNDKRWWEDRADLNDDHVMFSILKDISFCILPELTTNYQYFFFFFEKNIS